MSALSALLELPPTEQQRLGVEHTAKEIAQQPESWGSTLAACRQHRGQLERLRAAHHGRPVLLAGAGTSDFIGRSLARLLRHRWQTTVDAVPSTELLTEMDDWLDLGQPTLAISFSRSGDSSEGVAVMEELMRRFPRVVTHLVITCNRDGAMAKLAKQHAATGRAASLALVLDDAVNDRGLAMTSSFSNMVVAGQALAYLDDLDQYAVALDGLRAAASVLLPQAADAAPQLAGKGFERVCFLGTGALQAAAEESALKVQELTAGGIFTMAQSAMGLRHGPLSFIDRKTLVVAYVAGNQQTQRYEADLLAELRAKEPGVTIAAVGFDLPREIRRTADVVLDCGAGAVVDALRPPLDVIFGQLLGLFCSLKAGLQPDTPSPTGAITRVVSHVRIYPAVEDTAEQLIAEPTTAERK